MRRELRRRRAALGGRALPPKAATARSTGSGAPRAAAAPDDEGPREYTDEDGKTVGFSTGLITIGFGGGPTLPWPTAVPGNVPGAIIPLPPPRRDIPTALRRAGFAGWLRVIGSGGRVGHALRRDDPRGFTLIGEGVLDLVDPAELDAELDAADEREREFHAQLPTGHAGPWEDPRYTQHYRLYTCFDGARRRRTPLKAARGTFGPSFSPAELDGDEVRWHVARLVDVS